MTASHDADRAGDLPSPFEPDASDSPDLLDDPPLPDAPVETVDPSVELPFESAETDAVDQILEVPVDDDHDRPV